MAEQAQTGLSFDDSYALLSRHAHAPVFFNKLACDWGIVPQTEEDAKQLLTVAGVLRQANQQVQVKQAAAGGQFGEFSQKVAAVVHQHGLQPADNSQAVAVKVAAAELAKNPAMCEAALVYMVHGAQAAAAQG